MSAFSDTAVDYSLYEFDKEIWFGRGPRFGNPWMSWMRGGDALGHHHHGDSVQRFARYRRPSKPEYIIQNRFPLQIFTNCHLKRRPQMRSHFCDPSPLRDSLSILAKSTRQGVGGAGASSVTPRFNVLPAIGYPQKQYIVQNRFPHQIFTKCHLKRRPQLRSHFCKLSAPCDSLSRVHSAGRWQGRTPKGGPLGERLGREDV